MGMQILVRTSTPTKSHLVLDHDSIMVEESLPEIPQERLVSNIRLERINKRLDKG